RHQRPNPKSQNPNPKASSPLFPPEGDRGRPGWDLGVGSWDFPPLRLVIDVSESTIPLRKLADRLVEVFLLELRPFHRRDPELRVRDLPEQEVRDPKVAARADEQVGIRRIGIVEIPADRLLVDLLRLP